MRYGKKSAYKGPPITTVLLQNIVDAETNEVVTDHLWFNHTKGFEGLGDVNEGDVILFEARVKSYIKGYQGHNWEKAMENPVSLDYKLSYPTQFTKKEDV